MKHSLTLAKLMAGLLFLGALTLPLAVTQEACTAPVTVQTPAGKTAYTADQIVVRVNELQNAAIKANATGGLDTTTTRTIVQFAVSADKVLAVTPAGWQQTVGQAWKETKTKLPVIANPTITAVIQAVDVVLAAYGG